MVGYFYKIVLSCFRVVEMIWCRCRILTVKQFVLFVSLFGLYMEFLLILF